ncbi:MAG TPA: NUDIX domain-containing protein [Candidatus Thermoplasmatota archaeon]|nr:NUDIX domain-containing protein [Candidatus Thermoplasmatota archaeon]
MSPGLAYYGPPVAAPPSGGFAVLAHVIVMDGTRYALFRPHHGGEPVFPHGAFKVGEAPAEAARRLVKEWTGTDNPKLEVVDFLTRDGPGGHKTLEFVFRALLTDAPKVGPAASELVHRNRMELPDRVGTLQGRWIEDALKTGLNYKLTRA